MTSRRFFTGRAVGLAVVLVLVGMIVGFYALNNYIYQQKQRGSSPERYRATLAGEFVCLPHLDSSGPQTLECAFGILTDAGGYYAMDFALMSQVPPEISVGDRIMATGLITPLELLSTDQWRKYPIDGIFSVTDSVQRID